MFIIRDIFHWLSRYRLKLIVLLAAAVWGTVWVWPWSNRLNIVFCAVGQGDASVVSRGFTQVLIDAGPQNKAAADCLSRRLPFFDHHLEAVIISHPQADHFAGLSEILNRYQVEKFIYNGYAGDSRAWAELSRLIEQEKSQIITVSAGDKLKIGEVEIDVLWPKMTNDQSSIFNLPLPSSTLNHPSSNVLGVASSRNLNADALVLSLSYGGFSALFTGDIGESEESSLRPGLADGKAGPFNILKVAHHGSNTSSSAEFLKAVSPQLAVIEVGKNSYGHPAVEVLERLSAAGARVLRTDRDGDIVVETDGKTWNISNIKNQKKW